MRSVLSSHYKGGLGGIERERYLILAEIILFLRRIYALILILNEMKNVKGFISPPALLEPSGAGFWGYLENENHLLLGLRKAS